MLERMRATLRQPLVGHLSLPVDASLTLRPLIEAVERLEQAATAAPIVSLSLVETAKRQWAACDSDLSTLSSRHIRALCGESRIATNPAFVRAIAQSQDFVSRRQWIERLAESYLTEWGRISAPEGLEALLRSAVASFAGRSERITRYRPVAHSLFSSNAPKWLAAQIVTNRRKIPEYLDEWRIAPGGGLGEATANAAVDRWVDQFELAKRIGIKDQNASNWCTQLIDDLLQSPMLDHRKMARAVSSLILWDKAELNDDVHAAIERFVLTDARFGDPRLPANKPKWESVSASARQRVVAWLSRLDLQFFFEMMIQEDPHGRRDFWLRYIDQVEDSNVALCDVDRDRLIANTRESERKGSMRYSRITGNVTVSAFLMRFRGAGELIFVEFSEAGNALYVYDAGHFQRVAGGIRNPSFTTQRLKHKDSEAWIPHHENWQWRVQHILARHGIRPS